MPVTTSAASDIFDLPEWDPIANAPLANAAGMYMASDYRNNEDRHPFIFYLTANAGLQAYNVKNDGWITLNTPGLTGTFGAGAAAIFHPSQGPRGTLAAGWSTTQGALTTALPSAPGINQLANRGDGRGFKIRIIGNHAGGSGIINERYIIANTSSTTPTITLDSPLTFTPALGDAYEIISGRLFMLGASTLAAGMWKYYDVCTNSYSGNLATTNLPATVGTDSAMVALSELHVPYNRAPGEGFVIGAGTYGGGTLGCLTATASAATSITGQAAAGDAGVLLNQYRNFQIRIVEDATTPTSVGQRRNITSHTAGASPVYTVATWTVTPSATAKFVIENNDDRILLWSSASTSTFNYNIGANTWDTATWAARPVAPGAGVKAIQAFGIVPDAQNLIRNSFIYSLRGAGSTGLEILDIAGAATGSWTTAATYGLNTPGWSTGTSATYDPATNQGRYWYLNLSGGTTFYRLDLLNRSLEPWGALLYNTAVATVGEKAAFTVYVNGTNKFGWLYTLRHSDTPAWRMVITR